MRSLAFVSHLSAAINASWGIDTEPYSRIRARFGKVPGHFASLASARPKSASGVITHSEGCDKRLLGNADTPVFAHALLALFLFF